MSEALAGSLHFGTCGWSFEEWKGSFYPTDLPHADWLEYYAKHFPAVEVDSTFYHLPSPAVAAHWAEATPADFLFSCKVPRSITHDRKLRDVAGLLGDFLNSLEPLRAKLGCVLVQLPAWFRPRFDEVALRDFVRHLPAGWPWAVELRSPEWHHPRTAHLFEEYGVCWVWSDLSPVKDAAAAPFDFHLTTTDWAVLRLVGDPATLSPDVPAQPMRIEPPRDEALDNWAAKIRQARAEVKRVLVFAGNHYEGYAPATAERLAARLGTLISLPTVEERLPRHPHAKQLKLWG